MSTKKSKCFMAMANGVTSSEEFKSTNYIGVAAVSVLAVNPTKVELEKIYNRTLEQDPVYTGESEVGLEKKIVKQLRLDFIVKTDTSKINIDMLTKVSLFIKDAYQYNRDETKVKVINKYGETLWLPVEHAKNRTVPENLNWYDVAGIRPAYIGEEELTSFIKCYLSIPNKSYKRKDGTLVVIDKLSEAEATLDNIPNYFDGDISELKSALSLQPNNKIKIMFGVKLTEDNHQYQTAYTKKFLKNGATDYTILDRDLQSSKAAGAYNNTEFSTAELHEYINNPTTFNSENPSTSVDSIW